MEINSISDFRRAIREPYAWPGGYPLYFLTSDGAAISFKGARENLRPILEAIAEGDDNGWRITRVTVNWEDPRLYCEAEGYRIESAYAEDDADEDPNC